jgi:hypothetical protein
VKEDKICAKPECSIVKEQMSSGLDDVCGLTDKAYRRMTYQDGLTSLASFVLSLILINML